MTNKHDLFERIYNIENLFYAWKKAKYIYDTDMDFMYDTKELAEFEADLDKNLQKISEQIKSGKYRLKKLIPLWLPKVSTPKESRQNFYVSVEDQVVWIAVINVIGPILDDKMPYWSFGNRLYMPIWKEDAGETDINGEPKKTAKFGYYSSASPKLYRNWSSSWPLFRKAVSISIKNMYSSAGPDIYEDIFSDEDQEDIENIGAAPDSFKIQYWTREYWHNRDNDKAVYYATIDLKKFYPSIDSTVLFKVIVDNLNEESDSLKLLIKNLLDFHVDTKQFDDFNDENPELKISEKNGAFKAVPTGLFVAGFLANIAMMPVDLEVYKRIDGNRRIGHFRFVDDHVFLAYSFDELNDWIDEYKEIVKDHLPSLEINKDKTEPELFREYIKSGQEADRKSDAMDACRLDPHLPTPFTTLTLKKLSGISSNPFDLLDDADKKDLLKDIEHILVTEFPDNEIRSDTRVSWAASILIRLVPLLDNNIEELYNKRKNMEEVILTRDKLKEKIDKLIEQAREEKEAEYQELSEKAKEAEKAFNEYKEHDQKSLHKIYKHIFLLISKALKDNMAKPKLWKKCVDYCYITGFDGVPILLDILKVDNSLTIPGKQYLFNAVLASIIKNVFVSINIHKSNMFNDKEKYSANLFTASIKKLLGEFQRWPELHSKLSDKLLQQLSWAIDIYNIECNDPNRNIKFSNELLCMLWHYIPIYTCQSTSEQEPEIIEKLINNKSNIQSNTVYNKILLMFPQKLSENEQIESFKHKPSHLNSDNLNSDSKYITLQDLYMNNFNSENDGSLPYHSEMAKLKILSKIIDEVLSDDSMDLDFDNLNSKRTFINCAPCNFFIDSSIKKRKNWNSISNFFNRRKRNQGPIIKYKHICDDYRFDSQFYNTSGNSFIEKRLIYSCIVLLITLLSESMEFNPLIGRSSALERNYKQLFMKLDMVPISSYTQAILVGALSDKWYALQNHTDLDYRKDNRTKEPSNSPIKIETLADLKMEINNAIHTLQHYQLSLQDQQPRQLIPISLINLTKDFNPYKGSEDND